MSVMDKIKADASANNTDMCTAYNSRCSRLEDIIDRMFAIGDSALDITFSDKNNCSGQHADDYLDSGNEFCYRRQLLLMLYKPNKVMSNAARARINASNYMALYKWRWLLNNAGYLRSSNAPNLLERVKQYKLHIPLNVCCIPELYSADSIEGSSTLLVVESVSHDTFNISDKIPGLYNKLQWYMYLTGLHNSLAVIEDRGNAHVKFEMYQYEDTAVQCYIDRINKVQELYKRLVERCKMPRIPEPYKSDNHSPCRSCRVCDACYNKGIGRVSLR